jgi:hypothetical protein
MDTPFVHAAGVVEHRPEHLGGRADVSGGNREDRVVGTRPSLRNSRSWSVQRSPLASADAKMVGLLGDTDVSLGDQALQHAAGQESWDRSSSHTDTP